MKVARATFLFVFMLSLPGLLLSQTSGEITGEIHDQSGAAVMHALVKVTNKATGAVRSATTNEAGIYSFPSLQPGTYDITVSQAGFQAAVRRDVELQVQQTARVDFSLQVGQVNETVEVAGSAPLLATESATVGTVIENRRIVELPLNGRNFLQLVALSPNVTYGFAQTSVASLQGGARASTNISVAGQRGAFNHYTLDGLENTNVQMNTYSFLPSIDALYEFKVQTGIYPAEFGRAASQINVSTKSGGNNFHGSAFEFVRNDKLDAENYAFTTFRPAKDAFRRNQYGFALGGPVWIPKLFNGRNRLFFMSNFEGLRDRKQLRTIANVATVAMRNGDFSGLTAPLFDPASHLQQGTAVTATPFPGNRIPGNRLPSTSTKLLEFYPQPNQPGSGLVSNYQVGQNRRIDSDQFTQRVDFNESAASSWFGRFSRGDELQLVPGLDRNGSQILNKPWQAMLSNTRVLSPTMVNEFRFGVNRFTNVNAQQLAFQRDVVGELGIAGLIAQPSEAWGIPLITLSNVTSFGADVSTPNVTYAATFQWTDNFSWMRGKHSLRMGAEVRRDRWNASQYTFARGQFVFDGEATQNPAARAGTGFAFGDFMLGYCQLCRASVSRALSQFRGTAQSYYFDDTWKARPNLTLSFGLRYENTPPWADRSGRYVNLYIPFFDSAPNQDPSHHPTLVRVGSGDFYQNVPLRFNPAIQVARDGRLGARGVRTDNNDFAPRVGMSWSPRRSWTVRTGAGVFYSQDTGTPVLDPSRNLAGYRFDQMNPDFPNLTWDHPFNNLAAGTIQVNNPAVLGVQNNRRTPYIIQYLFNAQHEFANNMLVEMGYLGSVGRKLQQYRYFNYAQPSPAGAPASRLPYPELGAVFLVDGIGKSNYNSLQFKLQRRLSSGLTFLTGYTWAKSIDTGSAIRNHAADTLFAQNEFCVQCDRALSSYNVAHRVVSSVLYELPFGKGKRFAGGGRVGDVVLGGWQVGSILTLQSGFPLTVMAGSNQSNTGHQADRVNATGQPSDLPRGRQDPERFFNTGAYALQPFGSFGSAGRNTVIGPGVINWDFSATKGFKAGEHRSLEFRLEGFNGPNHPNWGLPNTLFTNVDFGKVRSTQTDMRELQMALKFIF